MSEQTSPPSTQQIIRVVDYIDDVGRRVVHREIVEGERPNDFTEFVGLNQVLVQVQNGPPQPTQYRFPIDGVRTLREAFARWDQCAHDYGNLHMDQLRRQYAAAQQAQARSLVVPNAQQAQKILTGP